MTTKTILTAQEILETWGKGDKHLEQFWKVGWFGWFGWFWMVIYQIYVNVTNPFKNIHEFKQGSVQG